jgi:type II secretory pathway pseudopilin PulG
MNISVVISIAVAIAAVIAAASMLIPGMLREKRRAEQEDEVAKAAQEYLSRFEIRARIVASTLPDNRIVLMIETPPHKKLRFSYIIEQPIKQFVLKQTEIEVDRMFWRFPMPPKNTQAPEVQYGAGATIIPSPQAAATQAAEPGESQAATLDFEDEYFHGQSYQIEEVSWDDFSTVSKPNAGNGSAEK